MASQKNINTLPGEAEEIPVTNFSAAPGVTFLPEQGWIRPCNFIAQTDIPAERAFLMDGARFIMNCPLSYAFTHIPVGIAAHLQQLWYTAHFTSVTTDKGNKLDAVEFTTSLGTVVVTTGVVRAALRLPNREKNEKWASPPSTEEIQAFLDTIGYEWPIDKDTGKEIRAITKVEKKRMPARWQYVWGQVIQCLCSKFGSQDQAAKPQQDMGFALFTGRKLNYADYIFTELYNRVRVQKRDKSIPFTHFISMLFKTIYKDYPS